MACAPEVELPCGNSDTKTQIENDDADEENSRKSTEICKFHLNGKCRFADECRNIHIDASPPQDAPPSPRSKRNSPKKLKQHDEEFIKKRKSSMKTSENVIHRILWDDKLPEVMFSIGYLDRFVGIVEKPFMCFCWEPISAVDNTVLAVPKHRIQYFKYKGVKVWDKNERLDRVFGSTGYQSTIYEFINEIDEKNEEYDDLALKLLDSDVADHDVTKLKPRVNKRKVQMNHFICVTITEKSITDKFASIQNQITRYEPAYADCFRQVPTLHVTLATIHLDDADAIEDTEKILNDVTKIANTLPILKLTIRGLDLFQRRVLYAKVQPQNPKFYDFVSNLNQKLKDNDINVILDHPTYIPHVTLMKPSPAVHEKRLIDPVLLTDIRDEYFGIQPVNNLSLYSTKTDEDGCYICINDTTITGFENNI